MRVFSELPVTSACTHQFNLCLFISIFPFCAISLSISKCLCLYASICLPSPIYMLIHIMCMKENMLYDCLGIHETTCHEWTPSINRHVHYLSLLLQFAAFTCSNNAYICACVYLSSVSPLTRAYIYVCVQLFIVNSSLIYILPFVSPPLMHASVFHLYVHALVYLPLSWSY